MAGCSEPPPQTWEALRERLALDVNQEPLVRWREVVARETAMAELNEAAGQDVIHRELREPFDACKKKVLELHEVVQEYAGPFDLQQPTSRGC